MVLISRKISWLICLLQLLFMSCTSFEDEIHSYINDNFDFTESDTSKFTLSKAIGIDSYDTLYILQEWVTDEEVSEMIHINYKLPFFIRDSQRGFVFVKNNEVIKAELLHQRKVFIQQYQPITNDTFMVWREYSKHLKQFKYVLFQ